MKKEESLGIPAVIVDRNTNKFCGGIHLSTLSPGAKRQQKTSRLRRWKWSELCKTRWEGRGGVSRSIWLKAFLEGVCGVRCCGCYDSRNDWEHLQNRKSGVLTTGTDMEGRLTRPCHVTPKATPRDKIYEIFMLFVCLTFAVITQIDISMMQWKRVRECDKLRESVGSGTNENFQSKNFDICIICRFKHSAAQEGGEFLITSRAYRSIFCAVLARHFAFDGKGQRNATHDEIFLVFFPVRYTVP